MSRSVLLVEDDRVLRNSLREALSVEGYDLKTAASLADARAQLQHLSPGKAIDLVVLDLGLPDGDGESLLPFHANLLQAAIAAEAPIQPIALQFLETQSGAKSFAPCYHADDTLLGSLWRTLCAPPLLAQVRYGATQHAEGKTRRQWADALRSDVETLLK